MPGRKKSGWTFRISLGGKEWKDMSAGEKVRAALVAAGVLVFAGLVVVLALAVVFVALVVVVLALAVAGVAVVVAGLATWASRTDGGAESGRKRGAGKA